MAVDWIARAMAAAGGGGGGEGKAITSVTINASGDLVINYDDGTTDDVGHVVGADGADGAVYVPSIVTDQSGEKYLHWDLRTEPGPVPSDTYIGPQDDWEHVDDSQEGNDEP